jgi:hypothetical protein
LASRHSCTGNEISDRAAGRICIDLWPCLQTNGRAVSAYFLSSLGSAYSRRLKHSICDNSLGVSGGKVLAKNKDEAEAQNTDGLESREYGWWAFFVEFFGNIIRAVLKIF